MDFPQPKISSVFELNLPKVEIKTSNDIQCHFLNDPAGEIVKLEWVFKCGSKDQLIAGSASFAAHMLMEGTIDHDSRSFSENIDLLGAYLNVEVSKDFISYTLHVLEKNLESALSLIGKMFTNPRFEESDFLSMLNESKQEFLQNLHSGAFVARQAITELVFSGHRYGVVRKIEDYEKNNIDTTKSFAQTYLIGRPFELFVSGAANQKVQKIVNDYLQALSFEVSESKPNYGAIDIQIGKHTHELSVAKQDSIRMAKLMPSSNHQDYLQISILNTILGGYFGSLLMQEIREQKGLTYGISSSLIPGREQNILMIGSDVVVNKGTETVEDIISIVDSLKDSKVIEEELNTVQTYLKGSLLKSFDGVFGQMDRYQSTYLFGTSIDFFKNYMKAITEANPKHLAELAKVHFDSSAFASVVVSN